nr:SRPBCC family protein [Petropleomorpha daqingensis]
MVRATAVERAVDRPGDDVVPSADVVMDRAFTVPAPPAEVWPWLAQLGKGRAGWYLPRSVERLVPPRRRASRSVDPRWQDLAVGDVIPDYGGPHETFAVTAIEPPRSLVYRSRRGRTDVSWSISLAAEAGGCTRVHLRLRLAPVRHRWLAEIGGGLLDLLTIAGMAAGLRERLRDDGR